MQPLATSPDFVSLLGPISAGVSIVLAIVSIGLGGFAVWLSLHLYNKSNEISAQMMKALSDITASTKSTESTTSQITERVVDVLVAQFGNRIAQVGEDTSLRLAKAAHEKLPSASSDEVANFQESVRQEVNAALKSLTSAAAAASGSFDWGPFVRRIDELERKNRFLSVKFLDQKLFADAPGDREGLRVAIDRGMLVTYRETNPKDAAHPVLACRLDRLHPTVVEALRGK